MSKILKYVGQSSPLIVKNQIWRTGDENKVSDDLADHNLTYHNFVIATCEVTKDDGEVCGREKPCSYHD